MNYKIKSIIFFLSWSLLSIAVTSCKIPDTEAPGPGSKKNVILLIGDGCGYNQIKAADLYLGVENQVFENYPVKYAMSTYSYGQSYDKTQAWSDFDYVTTMFTDSAAAATAMSTGSKTANGNIGYSPDDLHTLKHAFEYAEEKGFATGVVTSVPFSHATAAGFVAHNVRRTNYSEIALEMIESSKTDVIMGACNPGYNNDGEAVTSGSEDYTYVGGIDTWNALVAGTAGNNVDANHDQVINNEDSWRLIQTREEFEAYARDTTPEVSRLCGVPRVGTTLQQSRSENSTEVFGDPKTENVPALGTMATAALNVLNRNEKGFMLMVEGGAIDWACHNGQANPTQLARIIEEVIDFFDAITAVNAWVEANSSWDETLVIVTGDHECGYLWGPDSGLPATWNPLTGHGPGELPGMVCYSSSHTNSLIPLFAKGCHAELFDNEIAGNDTIRGTYIENTSIGKILITLCYYQASYFSK
ncbi:MAG: alkaline phosphatase [Spirochaetales bacterium]|nr:alkaline phosphatase [Spirochaetales bacterium]